MQVNPYSPAYLNAAAELFAASLRGRVPILPDHLSDPARAAEKLAGFLTAEALAFWPRYFTPVAVSLVRVVGYVEPIPLPLP